MLSSVPLLATPALAVSVPLMAVVVLPARWLLVTPFTPVTWRLVIVAHGDSKEWGRDVLGGHGNPGAMVPGADVPSTIGKDVALAVVLKDIGWRSGRVVHREAWDDHPLRRRGEIDSDVHVHLREYGF